MNKNMMWAMILGSVLACQIGVSAADKPKMTPEQEAAMAKAMELGKPSAGHQALGPFAGRWTNKVKFWMKPGDKPQESAGTNDNIWILDGRFLKQDYHGTWDGKPFEGLSITGYDNIRAEYQSVWIDNMMTGMMYGTGAYDAAAKTVKVGGTFACPMTGQKDRAYRYEWKVIDNDNHTYTSYDKTPDGKEYKSMEITFKRAK